MEQSRIGILRFICDKENELLKLYKDYCENNPDDEQIDMDWEAYSFFVQARRTGRIVRDNEEDTPHML